MEHERYSTSSEIGAGDLGEVDAAHAHRAALGPVEAREQFAQGGLAATGRADKGDDLTGRDLNVAVAQHRHPGDVPVLEPVGLDVEPSSRQCTRVRRHGFRRRGENTVDAIEGDDRTRHLLEQEADDTHWEREECEQCHRLHEIAR